jgi:hypothetical protein
MADLFLRREPSGGYVLYRVKTNQGVFISKDELYMLGGLQHGLMGYPVEIGTKSCRAARAEAARVINITAKRVTIGDLEPDLPFERGTSHD